MDESGSGIPENIFSVYGRAEDPCYWQNTQYKWCLSVELFNFYSKILWEKILNTTSDTFNIMKTKELIIDNGSECMKYMAQMV